MEMYISKERAIEFVVHQLKVGSIEEIENVMNNGTQSNRLELLNRILRASNREISFQVYFDKIFHNIVRKIGCYLFFSECVPSGQREKVCS